MSQCINLGLYLAIRAHLHVSVETVPCHTGGGARKRSVCAHVRSSGDVPCCTEASCSAFKSSGCHGCKERLFKAQSLNLNESVQMKMTFQFCNDEIQ